MLWVRRDNKTVDGGAVDLTLPPPTEHDVTSDQRTSMSATASEPGERGYQHERRRRGSPPKSVLAHDPDAIVGRHSAPAPGLHLRELFGILRRRAHLVVTIAVVGMIMAGVVGLMIPPKYTATVHLVVEPQPAELAGGRADEAVDTHVTLLGSRTHLRRVVENLSQDPRFLEPMRDASQPEVSTTEGDGRWLEELERRLGTWIGAFRAKVSEDGGGWLEELERRLGIWIEAFRRKVTLGEGAGTWLNEFERRLGIWIGALDRKGRAKVASLEEMERGIRVNQERRSRIITVVYSSANPEKAAAIANLIVQLYVDNLMKQRQAYASAEAARLQERITTAQFEMDSAGIDLQKARLGADRDASSRGAVADLQLRELERRVATSAQIYGSLLRRQKEMHNGQEAVTPGIEIFSPASVPDRPSSHNPLLFIVPALIVFAIGGSFLAVVLEQFDRGLRSEGDIVDALGIPCIGLVPRISRSRRARRPHYYLLKEPYSAYAEAIRSLVSVWHLKPTSRAPRVVLITSSVPKEGKTTLAVSLAAYAALIGRRTLLIDLDFRYSSMASMLDGEAERGVADLLLHECALKEAIRHVPDLGLDYLSMTRCAIDPVELVSREDMRRLLRQLRKRYDCILIDGSPLLGATEARLLASLADKVLFAVKWGSTRRELALSALNLLCNRRHPSEKCIDSVVAVITQVDLKKHARYRYGDVGEFLQKHSLTGCRHVQPTGFKNGSRRRAPTQSEVSAE